LFKSLRWKGLEVLIGFELFKSLRWKGLEVLIGFELFKSLRCFEGSETWGILV